MFDGTSRAKRNVSLRGKSKEENTRELSRRAEREREVRATERLHATRSVTLQRFIRGRLGAYARRRDERADWDKKMHDIERTRTILESMGAPFFTPPALLLSMQSQLLFFYMYPLDASRLARFCALLEAGFTAAAAASNPFSLLAAAVAQPGGARLWLLRMARLTIIAVHALGSVAMCDPSARELAVTAVAAAGIAGIVEALTDRAAWERRGVPRADAEQLSAELLVAVSLADLWPAGAAGRRWAVRTSRGLTPSSLFSVLAAALRVAQENGGGAAGRGAGAAAADAAAAICRAALRAAAVAAASPSAFGTAAISPKQRGAVTLAFATAVLPVLRLADTPWTRQHLVEPLMRDGARGFWQIVGAGATEAASLAAALPPAAAAAAIGNLLQLESATPAGAVGAAGGRAAAFVQLLSALLSKLPLHALLLGSAGWAGGAAAAAAAAAAADDPMDVGEEDLDDGAELNDAGAQKLDRVVRQERQRHAAAAAASRRRGEQLQPQDAEAAAPALRRLVDSTVIGRLFDAILTVPPAAAAASAAGGPDGSDDDSASLENGGSRGGNNNGGGGGGRAEGGGGAGKEEKENAVFALCRLYGDLLIHSGDIGRTPSGHVPLATGGDGALATSRAILSALAFSRPGNPIVRRLWDFLAAGTGTGTDLARYAGSAAYADARGGVGAALFLLCAGYSHQLLAIDDEDFYERQAPLSLAAVRRLAAFLRNWLCRLYWSDPVLDKMGGGGNGGGGNGGSIRVGGGTDGGAAGADAGLVNAHLMLAATRLFNQLYERNSRRSFSGPEQWYWPAISSRELQPPDMDALDSSAVYSFFYGGGKLALVLTNIPQVIPFQQRVAVFRRLMEGERAQHQQADLWHGPASTRIRVRRELLYEDSFAALNGLGSALKGRIQVTLINEHGVEEAGIDGGGVFKEFMDSLTKRAFDPQYGIFEATSDQLLYPNPASGLATTAHLEHFEFMGRVLGKALFEGILVEPQFSAVFLNKLLGRHTYIDDLYTLDPELYRNLVRLKSIAAEGGDVEDLSLTFSVVTSAFGEHRSWPLLPGGTGTDVAVTNANVVRYIHAMANFKLNVETRQQCMAFLRGFRDLIPVEWIGLFGPHELQKLIGGDDERGVDIDNLRANVTYAGGYHESQPVIGWFWDALRSFTPAEQGRFLRFVTSCSRQPLLGFEHMTPRVCVQKVPAGDGGDRLPSSATCMNLLKLPQYGDAQTLRNKLLYAINANAGFELT